MIPKRKKIIHIFPLSSYIWSTSSKKIRVKEESKERKRKSFLFFFFSLFFHFLVLKKKLCSICTLDSADGATALTAAFPMNKNSKPLLPLTTSPLSSFPPPISPHFQTPLLHTAASKPPFVEIRTPPPLLLTESQKPDALNTASVSQIAFAPPPRSPPNSLLVLRRRSFPHRPMITSVSETLCSFRQVLPPCRRFCWPSSTSSLASAISSGSVEAVRCLWFCWISLNLNPLMLFFFLFAFEESEEENGDEEGSFLFSMLWIYRQFGNSDFQKNVKFSFIWSNFIRIFCWDCLNRLW